MFNKIEFNGNTLDVPAGTSVAEAKEALSRFYPEVSGATHTIENGVCKFQVVAKEKGLA